MEKCMVCEFDKKKVLPRSVDHTSFKKELSHPENYKYILFRCINCGHHWCLYSYEPHSAFPYLVEWHENSIQYEVNRLPVDQREPFLIRVKIKGVMKTFDDFAKEPLEYLKKNAYR